MKDYSNLEPGVVTKRISLGSTAGLVTLVRLPPWVGSTISTIETGGADVKRVELDEAPKDATDIGSREYEIQFAADGPRLDTYRTGPSRPNLNNWPPVVGLAPATAVATTLELKMIPWKGR